MQVRRGACEFSTCMLRCSSTRRLVACARGFSNLTSIRQPDILHCTHWFCCRCISVYQSSRSLCLLSVLPAAYLVAASTSASPCPSFTTYTTLSTFSINTAYLRVLCLVPYPRPTGHTFPSLRIHTRAPCQLATTLPTRTPRPG